MKILFLSLLLSAAPFSAAGGDRERGLQLYREGRYQEAAAAFRAALMSEGDSPDLQYDLALASWRAGELSAAEIAVEKFAAQSAGAGADLHAGVLGGVRFDEAKALEHKADALLSAGGQPAAAAPGQPTEKPEDPLPLLEQALAKVTQAKDHFVKGAVAAKSPELLRNTERALRYQDELQKKIEELKKQQEEQKKDDDQKKDDKKDENKDDKKDENKDDKKDENKDDKKDDDKKQDDQKKDDQKKGDPKDQKSDEGKEGESKPEPKPGEPDDKDPKEPKPEDGKPDPSQSKDPKPGESKDEPKPDEGKPEEGKPEDGKQGDAKPRNDAPGELQEGKELSAEQTARLFDELKKLDGKQKAYRARSTSGRRAVERDW